MIPRMKQKWQESVNAKLKSEFGIDNPMALPTFEKIVVNVGMGHSLEGTKLNPTHKEEVLKTLTVITGQKPVVVKAKKSVSNFKVRTGYESGAMVTLRGDRMWEFFDRLVSLAIPRIKDFRGLKKTSFDKAGNYSFGVNEQGIFPEVDIANAKYQHGMHITLCFAKSNKEISTVALTEMGMPFQRPEDN